MTFTIIIEIVLLGIGLSMDAFSVALVDSLTMKDINKKRSIFIAFTFGFMQAAMPLVGFWIVEVVERIAGASSSSKAGEIAALIVTWTAFILLLIVGLKMFIEGIKDYKNAIEDKDNSFSYRNVLWYGFLTSIDALAAGVTMHTGLSTEASVWFHVSIIFVLTFVISLLGLFLGKQIVKILKGHTSIASIIGGAILVALSIWVIISYYFHI